MSPILVVCAMHRDRRELARLGVADACIFHEYASLELEELAGTPKHQSRPIGDPDAEIDRLVALAERRRVSGVLSTDDYPGTAVAAVVAEKLGLPGPSPRATMGAQHKLWARRKMREAVPEATPEFELSHGDPPRLLVSGPAFAKPCKSFFSVGARAVEHRDDWNDALREARLPDAFFTIFDRLCRAYADIDLPAKGVLVERLVRGRQATVEGIRQGGRTRVLGVVDSVYRTDVPSFARFEYPSSLPHTVQERMSDIARRAIEAIGYDDGGFNVEVTWDADSDRVWIIEVNPRTSSQFADLFEKVDGVNTYALLLDIARGVPARLAHRRGTHRFAASCVLRRFSNARVERTPRSDDLARALAVEPDARIEVLVTPGKDLADELQDGSSFRYGLVSVGGESRDDALRRAARVERMLPFHFRERSAMPPHARSRPTMREAESFSSNHRKPATAVTMALPARTTGPMAESPAPFRSSAK